MKPAKPMTLVGNAVVVPSSLTGAAGTFGAVTLKLRVRRGGMHSPATDSEVFVLPLAGARELAQMLIQASDQAEKQYGPQP